jgi:UDP-glucose 4-epimerase
MRILLTGGAGYIGSHTYLALISAGHQVAIFDNFSNSSEAVIDRLEQISGVRPAVDIGDVRDKDALVAAIKKRAPEAIIHFAGVKSVGESARDPLEYYSNNVVGSQVLLSAMQHCGLNKIVFSSSATVYGDPVEVPLTESHPLEPMNTYGVTKRVVEDMLRAVQSACADWSVVILRYFNPVGAHESGQIGEDPRGLPNNLMPFISQVAVGRRPVLSVFGDDYGTHDGTGVRDYIHVMDLVEGHVAAMRLLETPGCRTINLGTGQGYSVFEVMAAFERASGKSIAHQIVPRRPGDVAEAYADATLAQELIGWKAQRDLARMCADSWHWQSKNPNGYDTG